MFSFSQRTHQQHCLCQRWQDLRNCFVPQLIFSSDRTCILWKFNPDSEKKIEPVLKLTQNDAILTLSFNPLTYELFSGGAADFALFIPGRKEIPKEKFKEKIISSGWSADGQTLAFGSINGTLSFRQRNLDEKVNHKVFRMKFTSTLLFGAWNGALLQMSMRLRICWLDVGIRLFTTSIVMEKNDKNSVKGISHVTLFQSTSIVLESILS